VAALQGAPSHKGCWGYKRPQATPNQKKKEETSWLPALCLDKFSAFILSSKHKKHIFLSLVPQLGFEFQGVWMYLFSYYPYPFFFKASSSFHLAFSCLNNMIY